MKQFPGNECPESNFDDLQKDFEAFTEEFAHRKIYTELNEEIIRTIPDAHLVQAVVDFIGIRIGRDWARDVDLVPPLGAGFSAVYFLSLLETEVNNGGFNQMFYNQGSGAVVQAQRGAGLIGLKALESLIGEALAVEQTHRDRMIAVKEAGTLAAFMDSYEGATFDDIDDKFLSHAEEMEKTMLTFIRTNVGMFCGKSEG